MSKTRAELGEPSVEDRGGARGAKCRRQGRSYGNQVLKTGAELGEPSVEHRGGARGAKC